MAELSVLVADDDTLSRTVVATMLRRQGYMVQTASDGEQAWQQLQQPAAPAIALMDWMMPHLDGVEVCRRLRARETSTPPYVILLTSRDGAADVVEGLRAGADDYVTKPPHEDELLARVSVGARVVGLQQALAERVRSLEEALANVRQLQGLLPMCSYCKRIRDDKNYWTQVESYISVHADVQFSHGYCPECFDVHVRPQLEAMERE